MSMNSTSFIGSEMIIGGIIIMLSALSIDDTSRLMSRNGIYIRKLMVKVVRSLEMM